MRSLRAGLHRHLEPPCTNLQHKGLEAVIAGGEAMFAMTALAQHEAFHIPMYASGSLIRALTLSTVHDL